jgi:predicted nucleic acid-binding protein
MKTVFLDTNVVLDVLLQNEGFWQDSIKIFRLAELGKIRACVSASSMTDIFYVARKKLTTSAARAAIEKLLNLFEIVGVDGDDLRGALTLPIGDMEDALQAWCAMKAKADALITRDAGGFSGIDVKAVAPEQFKE